MDVDDLLALVERIEAPALRHAARGLLGRLVAGRARVMARVRARLRLPYVSPISPVYLALLPAPSNWIACPASTSCRYVGLGLQLGIGLGMGMGLGIGLGLALLHALGRIRHLTYSPLYLQISGPYLSTSSPPACAWPRRPRPCAGRSPALGVGVGYGLGLVIGSGIGLGLGLES